MKTRFFLIGGVILALLFAGFQQSALAKGGDDGGGNRVRITLTGSAAYPAAKAKATYKATAEEREFQVEAENLKSLSGKTVSVLVNGTRVGTMKVNALGTARLSLNTNAGAAVPTIAAGSSVRIRTAAGALIASGSF